MIGFQADNALSEPTGPGEQPDRPVTPDGQGRHESRRPSTAVPTMRAILNRRSSALGAFHEAESPLHRAASLEGRRRDRTDRALRDSGTCWDGAGGNPDGLLSGSRPFISSLVFRLDEQGKPAADGLRPDLGTQRGEVAVADLLVKEQASGRVLATFFRSISRRSWALTKASAGFKKSTALVFSTLDICRDKSRSFGARECVGHRDRHEEAGPAPRSG